MAGNCSGSDRQVVCALFPQKSRCASLFPNLIFQPDLTLLSPFAIPSVCLQQCPGGFGAVLTCAGRVGLLVRTDSWIFHMRCVPGLGFFLTHPDRSGWDGFAATAQVKPLLLD